ncbi:T9SS type A sorting domain-containing protein [Chitinophaga qingshengii]|uniref:T9SS type A sorting domain-containing protein n=1 Tax=Chitinophaga qingshengii TaxID=1569794 RepID=A0ABR7TNZ2_9BACT|nr:T9SS type A sorting domain-containing protein [Chitinophaga qingshengii]MBC9932194.1 T9SS type A sorting domain-containing protein [Chitinophaga qingshengii]
MHKKFYFLYLILLLCSTLLQRTQAQVYANSQTNGVTGLCLLCGVTNADNAVNTNLNDYSTYNISVGLLGVTVYQTLIFPSGSTAGCDSLVIGIGSDNAVLSVNLVGGLTVQTFNGTTANNDAHVVDSTNFRAWGNNRGEIVLRPSAAFDRVKVTLSSSLVGLLTSFHLYGAYRKPAIAPPVPVLDTLHLCKGDTTFVVASGSAGTTVKWYNAPTGGTLLYTGSIYMVSPVVSTDYYAEASANGCTSLRSVVNVHVHPKPADPAFKVHLGDLCNTAAIPVTNYTPDVFYKVHTFYYDFDGPILDTSFIVTNTDTVIVRDINSYFNANVDIEIQAVNKYTGCASNVVKQTMVFGAHSTYADVDTSQVTICKGDSVTLHAWAHGQPGNTLIHLRWYDKPTGGTLLYTGQYFRVSPADTTDYYVTPAYYCENLIRTKVRVNVRKLPLPIYDVPQGPTCGVINIRIKNYQPGYSYRARFRFRYSPQILLDTSFVVSHTDIISTPVFYPPLPAVTDVYIQAVDSLTGCRSDTAYNLIHTDGYAGKPQVDTNLVSICRGDSATLHGFVPVYTLARIRWYTTPTGGIPVYVGNYFKVSPQSTTTYYIGAGYGCEYPERTPVTIVVNQCYQQAVVLSQQPLKHSLELYPNPTTGEIRLQLDKSMPGSELIIRNLQGVEVQRSILRDNRLVLSSKLTNGIYFIEIRTGAREVYTGRVVLKR